MFEDEKSGKLELIVKHYLTVPSTVIVMHIVVITTHSSAIQFRTLL